jgi:glycosyltransferase involved in cell wall biosynthesis
VNGVQVHYLSPSSNPYLRIPVAKDSVSSLRARTEVDRLSREYKIDIVHGQSPSSYGYGLLRRRDILFVVTLHGTSFGEFGFYFDVPLSFINGNVVFAAMGEALSAFLTSIEYRCADKVIAVSRALAEETAAFYRLPKERIVTIHNGIDLLSFTDSQVGENREHTILSVGRLSWRKGYRYLIDAMPYVLSEYPNARLLLLGDGDQKTPLQRHVKKLGIDNSVLFLGRVSAERLHSLYHEADVYVQPSLYEPLGIAILEAMSMRKPVVGTRVGGIPELITNDVEGLLVEPGNSLQLVRAIMHVFSDSSCRRRFGSNARKRVEREFTWEAIAEKTLDLYTNLVNDK